MADDFDFGGGKDYAYRWLFEAVPDAMIVVDGQGEILLANTKAATLFGWPESELVGQKVESLVPERFAGTHHKHRERFSNSPRARPMGIELELYGRRRDGTEFPLEIALSPFESAGRSLVAASIRDLTHTLRYVTAAKRAHYSAQVVKLGELALRATAIDEILAEVPQLIMRALQSEIVIVYWTEKGSTELRARIAAGVPVESIESLRVTAASSRAEGDEVSIASRRPHFTNDYRDHPEHATALVAQLGVRSGLNVPLFRKSDQVGMLVTYSRQPSRWGEEEVHFMQAVGNVIGESLLRVEMEEQLAHVQRLESIGQLTGGIAHDFNNILTVVLGNLQILREVLQDTGGESYVKLVESAQRASKRGADLTQKLLMFSRKQSLAPSAIDLNAALGALGEMLQRTIGEAIQIEWTVAPGSPACMADPLQFDNGVVNLALNARDAMPQGGRLRIAAGPVDPSRLPDQVAAELPVGQYVVITVADTGQGMPPEVLRRAYEPFFTTKPSGKGSGLGLSMVYGFAKQSGGAIDIRSEPGQGTTVSLYFPAAETGAKADLRGAGLVGAPASRPTQTTILVVDDDAEVLSIATTFLANAGYRVLSATSTEDALRWISGTESISLLFTDVVLDGGDTGPKLAGRALRIRPHLPVLYTSGFAHGSLSVSDVRPAHFIAKPYNRDDLLARIGLLLGATP